MGTVRVAGSLSIGVRRGGSQFKPTFYPNSSDLKVSSYYYDDEY